MKTLLISSQYPPLEAGVPNFNFQLSKEMSGDEFCVITSLVTGYEDVDKNLSFPIYRRKFLTNYKLKNSIYFILRHIPFLFFFIKVIRKEKVDLVIQGEARLFLLALCFVIQKIFRVPYIVFHHGDGASPYNNLRSDRYVEFFLQKSHGVIVNSDFTKGRIMKKYGITADKIFLLTPGVDQNYFTPDVNFEALTERHSLQGKALIMTVGRLDKRKGHDHVIMAMPDIVKSIPNLTYLIVGEGEDRSRLEALVASVKMENHVLFAGTVSFKDLPAYYNLCDLFIMANREVDQGDTEGFGMVFIEANACGKAVVAGAFGGAIEAVEDGVSGIFTDATDPAEIARTVIGVLLNKNKKREMELAGRDRVIREFSWEVKRQEFKKILGNIR